MAWQHMSLAGLIEGNYTGIAGGGDPHHVILDENSPRSSFPNAGWMLYTSTGVGNSETPQHAGGLRYTIGTPRPNDGTYDAAFTPEETWNIDKKLDDGRPMTGNVLSLLWDDCTSATVNDDRSAEYLLDSTDKLCALFFLE